PVQKGDAIGHPDKVERPIQRTVATTDYENFAPAEFFHLPYGIEDRLPLISLDARNWRPLRLKRSAAGGDDHGLALELLAVLGANAEQLVAGALQRLHHVGKMKGGAEGFYLLHQRIDQALTGHERQSGNVVNRLFRIKLGALPAGPVENVDEMRLHIEQAELEHGE